MQQFSFQWHDPFNWINKLRPSLSAVLLKALDMKSENKLLPEKYVTLFFFSSTCCRRKEDRLFNETVGRTKGKGCFFPCSPFLAGKTKLAAKKLTGKYIIGWFSKLFPTSSFTLRRRLYVNTFTNGSSPRALSSVISFFNKKAVWLHKLLLTCIIYRWRLFDVLLG